MIYGSRTHKEYLIMLLHVLIAAPFLAAVPPPSTDAASLARWMVHELTWGVLSTTSTRSEGTSVGAPFGNPCAPQPVVSTFCCPTLTRLPASDPVQIQYR